MILAHAAVNPGHIPYSWKVLLSGYTPEYAYDLGRLDRSMPIEELKQRGHINERAHAVDQASDFSQRIRVGLPIISIPREGRPFALTRRSDRTGRRTRGGTD